MTKKDKLLKLYKQNGGSILVEVKTQPDKRQLTSFYSPAHTITDDDDDNS